MSQEIKSHGEASDKRLPDVYVKLLDTLDRLDVYSHKALMQFPKYERFLLCAEIRSSISAIERLVITARLLNRGGNWNNAGNAGLSALTLYYHRGLAYSYRGGRLANNDKP